MFRDYNIEKYTEKIKVRFEKFDKIAEIKIQKKNG